MIIKNRLGKPLHLVSVLFVFLILFSSCGSSKKTTSNNSQRKRTISNVDHLTPEDRRKYEYFFLEATRMKENGDYDAAFELLNHCLTIDPDAASSLYEISQFYLYLKQTEKALATMQKAVEMDPDNFWYRQSLAGFYYSKGEFQSAIKEYEDMVKQFPENHESLMVLVDLYNRVKDYSNVIHTLDRLEEKEGKSEQISMEKFRIYLTSGDNEKAFKEMESLANEYPYDMRYLTILGDVYMNNGKPDDAYRTYQKVLAAEPTNPMALLSMASYYNKTEQTELYQRQLDAILLNDGIDIDTKLDIMRQLIIQSEQADKDSVKIISLFESILDNDLEDAQIPMLYAQYLMMKGMEEESVPVFERILAIDPENTVAWLQLLSFALKKEDKEEIIRITESGLTYNPETLELYYYMALAYYQDNPGKALEILKKSTTQITAESDKGLVSSIYSMMGELYHAQKKKKEAYAAYDSALIYNPDNIITLNNYAYYLSEENTNLDKAEEMSYKAIKADPKNGTFLDTYAWILFMKERYVEAKIYIDEAMKNGGDESDVVVEHAGDIYYMSGDKEEALKYWQQALKMGSESNTLQKKVQQKKYVP